MVVCGTLRRWGSFFQRGQDDGGNLMDIVSACGKLMECLEMVKLRENLIVTASTWEKINANLFIYLCVRINVLPW